MADKVLVMIAKIQFGLTKRDRRSKDRLLCSNLVQISWVGANQRPRKETGVLENISKGGGSMALFVGIPVEPGTALSIVANGIALRGVVQQCSFRKNGYIVGLVLETKCELAAGFADSLAPEHLVDMDLLDLM